jgi:hypothetical protein
MAELPVLTEEDVKAEWLQPLPIERLELVGVELKENYKLPSIETNGLYRGRGVGMVLITTDPVTTFFTKLGFEELIPWECIPDAMASVQMIAAARSLTGDIASDAVLILIKRVARIKIERDNPEEREIKVTLSCGSADLTLACKISDLAEFISQPPETEERAARRDREIASFGWGRDSPI